MVALIEVLLGVFLAGLVVLELTGKTDFLGRRKHKEFVERREQQLLNDEEQDDGDDERPF
jgi:hypothetical protein